MNIVRRNALAVITIVFLTLGAIYVLILLAPIHVLKNWSIHTTASSYQRGGTLTLNSRSDKIRKAKGDAHRTVECDYKSDSIRAYVLETTPARRQPGQASTDVQFVLPTNIADTPVTCRLVISVTYTVYRFRIITENAVSNDFVIVK